MDITLIGLGYVGLPVACAFAQAGMRVFGVDKNERLLSALRDRSYSYTEAGLDGVLDGVLDKTLFVSDKITESDTYIVTVQTPVREDRSSDNSYVERALTELAPHIKDGNLVILESTVPIGSNKGFYKLLREAVQENISFSYCYCPESILPGNIFHEIRNNSRVLGGMTPEAAERAREIYDIINIGRKELTDVATAEFVKLTQNAHRDVELAFVNQLSVMCDAEGVDPFRVIEIANRHPRCNLLYPGSGVGGHCIAVDPYFLIERFGENASLISAARAVNDAKPIYIARRAIDMTGGDTDRVIGVLGLSYKANCEDCRESSGIAICRYLEDQGYRVLANEINSPLEAIDGIPNNTCEAVIARSDVIIIAQKHTAYGELDFLGKPIIDCVNLFPRKS